MRSPINGVSTLGAAYKMPGGICTGVAIATITGTGRVALVRVLLALGVVTDLPTTGFVGVLLRTFLVVVMVTVGRGMWVGVDVDVVVGWGVDVAVAVAVGVGVGVG